MYQSLRSSQLVLRLGLAGVFLWFGLGKFIDPQYWLAAWVPQAAQEWLHTIGIAPRDLMVLQGIAEVLVAISLATGYFLRFFAAGAVVLLLAVTLVHGPDQVLVRDAGLVAGLIALILWPERPYL